MNITKKWNIAAAAVIAAAIATLLFSIIYIFLFYNADIGAYIRSLPEREQQGAALGYLALALFLFTVGVYGNALNILLKLIALICIISTIVKGQRISAAYYVLGLALDFLSIFTAIEMFVVLRPATPIAPLFLLSAFLFAAEFIFLIITAVRQRRNKKRAEPQ